MYGLIALFIGYFIYLACYFFWRKNHQKIDNSENKKDSSKNFDLGKKITLLLSIKILLLTLLYLAFFNHKLDFKTREANLSRTIFNR